MFSNLQKRAPNATPLRKDQIQNIFLTAQSTQIKSVISVPIKDFMHHYPRALFNDIPGSGRSLTTYPRQLRKYQMYKK